MSIKNVAISAVLGLMFLSLLTIYMISLPSPLITFLSVLIMLVGLIMAQSRNWRDILILASVSVIVSMVAIGLLASARLGRAGTFLVLLLWAGLLFLVFTSVRRTIMPLPRDRAILIRNLITGSVRPADGPIVVPNIPYMEQVIATIPLYTLNTNAVVEKINTKRMNVDLIDVQVRYKVKDPKLALGGIPNLSQAQRDAAKELSKDVSEARSDLIFWESLLNRRMRQDIDLVVREVIFDNGFAQNPLEVQTKRLDLTEEIKERLRDQVRLWGGEVITLGLDRVEVNPEVRKAINKLPARNEETEVKEIEAQRDAYRIREVLGAEVEIEARRVKAIIDALQSANIPIDAEVLKALTVTADWQMDGDFSVLAQQPPEKK
ncbi:MAG TPA: SPFH domain-containing protein [Roseiflexaceae bacterium]|nr:SPFH domain-containing protein [Roseiflexaceae bacterium]